MEDSTNTTIPGAFVASLKRNNKQIRDDRADAIAKSARLKYKRTIEDLEFEIDAMKTDRENMLDMSPSNAQSLIVASDFKADEFVRKDKELSLQIREKEIELEISRKRYEVLFGGVE